MLHDCCMKPVLWISAGCALALTFSSCGNSGTGGGSGPQAVTGPFDSAGRYHEEWADDPSKWRKSGGTSSPHDTKSDHLPEIAANDQPPQNSNPLPPANVSRPPPVISHTEVISKPKHPVEKPEPVVVKSKHPVEKSEPVVVKSKRHVEKTEPEPAVKSKSKSVASKEKTKPKSSHYVVKAGDSLSAIASRTGSSVSAIQRENGISGTLIRPGQSLTIPKK